MYTTTTPAPLEAAVATADLADWLVADPADPSLPRLALMATGMVVNWLESELVSRPRRVVYQQWPYLGTLAYPTLTRQAITLEDTITLPYAQLVSVESVELYGEATQDYRILGTKPASLHIRPTIVTEDIQYPAIVVEYTAGYGPAVTDVPEEIRLGVMTLAAFLYEHRGNCEAAEAMRRSGAAGMLQAYKLRAVAL